MFPNIPVHTIMCHTSRFTLLSALRNCPRIFSNFLERLYTRIWQLVNPHPNRENLNFLYVAEFLLIFEVQTVSRFIVSKSFLGQQHRLGTSNRNGWGQVFRAHGILDWLSQFSLKENDKNKIIKEVSRRKNLRTSPCHRNPFFIFVAKAWKQFPWIQAGLSVTSSKSKFKWVRAHIEKKEASSRMD